MTRLGPARALGLKNRGSLCDGNVADIVVYERCENPEQMFASPRMVFRRGTLVYRDGLFLAEAMKSTVVAKLPLDSQMDALLKRIWKTRYGYSTELIAIDTDELRSDRRRVEWT